MRNVVFTFTLTFFIMFVIISNFYYTKQSIQERAIRYNNGYFHKTSGKFKWIDNSWSKEDFAKFQELLEATSGSPTRAEFLFFLKEK